MASFACYSFLKSCSKVNERVKNESNEFKRKFGTEFYKVLAKTSHIMDSHTRLER